MLKKIVKFPLLVLGIISLFAGLWAALGKLEWVQADSFTDFPSHHGALMVAGFLGTVIALERAVVLHAWWGYLAPLLSGAGTMAILAGAPAHVSVCLYTLGSLAYLVVFASFLRRVVNLSVGLLIFAGAFLVAGNVTWLMHGWDFRVILWWIGFLLITIAGERFELTHNFMGSNAKSAQSAFLFCVAVISAGTLAFQFHIEHGYRMCGAGMMLMSIWLLRFDIAKLNLRKTGLQRFMAICLMTGYVWLMLSGGIALWSAPSESGFLYDAALHAFFLGFVISMIFAHAPVIFPGITGFMIPFRGIFYAHFALLQASLLLRIGSDFAGRETGRMHGGLLNVAAILLFLASTIYSAVKSRLDGPSAS